MAVLRGSCGLGLNRPMAKDDEAEYLQSSAHLVFEPPPATLPPIHLLLRCRHSAAAPRCAQEAAVPLVYDRRGRCKRRLRGGWGRWVEIELKACWKPCTFWLQKPAIVMWWPLRSSSHNTSQQFEQVSVFSFHSSRSLGVSLVKKLQKRQKKTKTVKTVE